MVVKQHQLALETRENPCGICITACEIGPLPQANQHRKIAAILNDFGATTLFARQFAQTRNNGRHQLQNDRRADVRHDAKCANPAMFQRRRRQTVIHAHQPAEPLLMLCEIRRKLRAIHAGDDDERHKARNPEQPIVNKIRDFNSGILKQLAKVLKMLRNMMHTA